MGELQHGVYDDECKGLTGEEINAFYDFDNDGEPQVQNKTDPDDPEHPDEHDEEYLEEPAGASEVNGEGNGPGSEDNHDVINYSAFHYTMNR